MQSYVKKILKNSNSRLKFLSRLLAIVFTILIFLIIKRESTMQKHLNAFNQSLEITKLIEKVEHTEALLPLSCRLFALTHNTEWEIFYKKEELNMEQAFVRLTKITDAGLKPYIASAKSAFDGQRDIEHKVFVLVNSNESAKAQELLSSRIYKYQKNLYAASATILLQQMDSFDEYHVDEIIKETNKDFLIVVISLIVVIALCLWGYSVIKRLRRKEEENNEDLIFMTNKLQELNQDLEVQKNKLIESEEEIRMQYENLLSTNQALEDKSQLLKDQNNVLEDKNKKLRVLGNELKLKAEELRENSAYKSDFLAKMSHELRTPLNSILLLSKLLWDNKAANLSGEQEEFARIINSSGKGLLSLINQILDLSKVEVGKVSINKEPIYITDLTNELKATFIPLAQEKKIDFLVQLVKDIPEYVFSDKMRLTQVLVNLISNALKFTNQGSVILKIFTPENNNNGEDSLISFSVTDTGIGIPKDKLSIVFEAFKQADDSTQRKYGGTGLGLAISKEITSLLCGNLVVESEINRGSVFTLTIPEELVINEEKNTKKNPASDHIKSFDLNNADMIALLTPDEIKDDRDSIEENSKVALIIEDDVIVAEFLLEFVRKNEFKGVVAVSGGKGIEYVKKYTPGYIFLDIQLPEINGWQILQELKADKVLRQIPVCVISALVDENESFYKGAAAFLHKPATNLDLISAFNKMKMLSENTPKNVIVISALQTHAESISMYLRTSSIMCLPCNTIEYVKQNLDNHKIDALVVECNTVINIYNELVANQEIVSKLNKIPVIIFDKNTSQQTNKARRDKTKTIIHIEATSYLEIKEKIITVLHKYNDLDTVISKDDNTLRGLKVFLVDDNMKSIFSLTRVLEDLGAEVYSASDDTEVTQTAKTIHTIDIIIVNRRIDDSGNRNIITTLRNEKNFALTPLISITRKLDAEELNQCLKTDIHDYILEPYDNQEFVSMIIEWVKKLKK